MGSPFWVCPHLACGLVVGSAGGRHEVWQPVKFFLEALGASGTGSRVAEGCSEAPLESVTFHRAGGDDPGIVPGARLLVLGEFAHVSSVSHRPPRIERAEN